MSVPFLHPASHRGSRSELVMHNPNSAQVVTGPLIEWGWPGWHGPGTYQVPDGMGIVLWRGTAYAGSTSTGWKGFAGSFTMDSDDLSESLDVQFARDGVGTLRDNPTTSEHVPSSYTDLVISTRFVLDVSLPLSKRGATTKVNWLAL